MCILFNEKGTGSRGLFCCAFFFSSVNLFIVPVNNAAILVKSGCFPFIFCIYCGLKSNVST